MLTEYIVRNISLRLLDFIKKTRSLQVHRELQETQWLSRSDLEALQIQRLKKMVVHAFENVPFYRRSFEETGFNPYRFQYLNDLRTIPVLTKKSVRENLELLLAKNASDFKPRLRRTSGSTGEPLTFYKDVMSHSGGWANNWRAFSVVGFKLGKPCVMLSGGSLMGVTTPLKRKIYGAMMGMTQLQSYQLSSAQMERYIQFLSKRGRPFFLMYAYASSAHLLARYLMKRQLHHDIRLNAIFTTSEVLLPEQRDVIQQAFGCPVYDTYGNNESMLFGFECELQNGLHYAMEYSYLEVLDEEGRPCGPGETGRLIATNLTNYAMPFIRYDTGDLGSVIEEQCSCRRGLQRIGRILGRSRDLVITPDGRHIHGALLNHCLAFYKVPWVVAWHIRQEKIDHITVTLCPSGAPVVNDIERMKHLLQQTLGEDMRIDFVVDEKLRLTPAGKLKLVESFVVESQDRASQ